MFSEFSLPLSSELTGVANFVLCELLAMAYIMHFSGLVAGAVNHTRVADGSELDLRVFDFPHIGGGLVMPRSATRYILIVLRLSALLAVAASNFGLEGRTTQVTHKQQAALRGPGRLQTLSTASLFNATERRMRCARAIGSELHFGAVIDGVCYQSLSTAVVIKTIGLQFERFRLDATQCAVQVESQLHFTIFRCRHVDITCLGEFEDVSAPELSQPGRCHSVAYHGGASWLCPFHSAVPGVKTNEVECRRMEVRRADIKVWPEIYMYRTMDLETAVFGAAYGVERRTMVAVPAGERNITVVTIVWVASVGYLLFLIVVVTIWTISIGGGRKRVAHDEKALVRLISEGWGFGDASEAAVFQEALKSEHADMVVVDDQLSKVEIW